MSERRDEAASPGVLRRIAALVYDSMLVTALLMGATALVLPLTAGEAVPTSGLAAAAFRLYLVAILFAFFTWCWVRGGQTLGMRAWRLRVQNRDGTAIGWRRAGARWAGALLIWGGLALAALASQRNGWLLFTGPPLAALFLVSLGGRRRPAWHDALAGTRVQLDPPRQRAA